jgi:two-component system, NarL family, invasion response regulator UvrY
MTATNNVRVLLGDDHPIVLKGYAAAIRGFGYEIVGMERTPTEVIRTYEATRPQLTILDIRFGGSHSGFEIAKRIFEIDPDARLAFLSQFDQDYLISEAYRLGAKTFITKDSDLDHIAVALESAANGETYLLPDIAQRIAKRSLVASKQSINSLSKREIDIIRLMSDGKTNAEIADALGLSLKTISNYSQGIKDALGIQRAAELTKLAIREGLIDL